MNGKLSGKVKISAKKLAYAGVAAATLTAAKFVLSAIPNVEVVTLLTAVYGFTLGLTGLIAVYAFVTIEMLIYGFGTWVISYYIYWPLVCVAFIILARLVKPERIISTILAVILTILFGVITSLVDVGLASGYFENFFQRFAIYYTRGIYFYIIQIVTNAIIFPILFVPLTRIITSRIGGNIGLRKDT